MNQKSIFLKKHPELEETLKPIFEIEIGHPTLLRRVANIYSKPEDLEGPEANPYFYDLKERGIKLTPDGIRAYKLYLSFCEKNDPYKNLPENKYDKCYSIPKEIMNSI